MLRLMLLAVLAASLCASAAATIFHVYADGSGDFATIQEAIDACSNGDVIMLYDGVFTGEGNRDLDFRGLAITIRSLNFDPQFCVLDCQGSQTEPHRVICFDSAEGPGSRLISVTLRGGDVRSGPDPCGGALALLGASPQISGCIFEDNRALWGGAICLQEDSSPEISHCRFLRNVAHYGGGALDLYGQCRPTISDCAFWRNETSGTGAALSSVYSTAVITGCTFAENVGFSSPTLGIWSGSGLLLDRSIVAFTVDGMGILCEDGSAFLSCCDIFGNAHGDWIGCVAEQYGLRGNIRLDPLFCDLNLGELTLDCLSPCAPGTPPNEECEELIGAWDVGCGSSPAVRSGWGAVKATFR